MPDVLKVLILEDRPEDAELLIHELRRGGMKPETLVVAGEQEFRTALAHRWDVILGDYRLPGFDAFAALRILHQRGQDIPFIVITATLGDEAAAECIKRGAADYLLKDRLARLAPAIKQAVTERRLRLEKQQVEAELGDTEKRLQRLFERTHVVPYVWSWRERRFISVGLQAEGLLGYPAADWLLPHFRSQRFHPEDRDRVKKFVRETATKSGDYEIEYRLVSREGRDVWVRDIVGFDATSDDYVGHGFLFDVTEAKRRDQQLVQAQKMEAVGQLTGGVAHDFNNILGVVIGNLDELLEMVGSDPKAKLAATSALDAAMRGAELIRRLLAFSRIQSLQPKAIDLGRIVRDMEPFLRRSLGEHIKIKSRLGENLWPVMADRGQFENAVLNLAINARDAMAEGGKLTITCANTVIDEAAATAGDLPVGEFVTLAVSDTGTGIPPEILSRVFEPFFTTKEVGKGSGLGLSMVFGYTRQSGGTVKIYSEVGHGTEVRIYLPRAASLAIEQLYENGAKPAPSGNERILVVEDKADVRKMAVRLLESLGYRTAEAEDAASALAILDRDKSFDLLFTDLVMPGMKTGVDLAREVRRQLPRIAIVFTSGFSDPATMGVEANALGVTIVSKPYRKAELAQHLRAALDRRTAGSDVLTARRRPDRLCNGA